MQHDSADDADEHQADSSEYEVCPCSKTHQTRAERLVAGRRQKPQRAVCERLHIQRRCMFCIPVGHCVCCGCFDSSVGGFNGGRVWRSRGRCNGVAHGGCVGACIELTARKRFQQRVETLSARKSTSGVFVRSQSSGVVVVSPLAATPHSDW